MSPDENLRLRCLELATKAAIAGVDKGVSIAAMAQEIEGYVRTGKVPTQKPDPA